MLELPVMLPAAPQSLYRLMILSAQRPRKILPLVGVAVHFMGGFWIIQSMRESNF